MRTVHRITSLFVVLVTLFLGITGTWVQLIDLQTLLRHAPATDADMMAIREDKDGPDDFEVLGTAEYTAPTVPQSFDYGMCVEHRIARRGPDQNGGSAEANHLIQRLNAAYLEIDDRQINDFHDVWCPCVTFLFTSRSCMVD